MTSAHNCVFQTQKVVMESGAIPADAQADNAPLLATDTSCTTDMRVSKSGKLREAKPACRSVPLQSALYLLP